MQLQRDTLAFEPDHLYANIRYNKKPAISPSPDHTFFTSPCNTAFADRSIRLPVLSRKEFIIRRMDWLVAFGSTLSPPCSYYRFFARFFVVLCAFILSGNYMGQLERNTAWMEMLSLYFNSAHRTLAIFPGDRRYGRPC